MSEASIVLFLEYEDFSPEALAKLSAVFNVAYCGIEDLGKFERRNSVVGIFVRLKSYIDDSVFNHLPNLKFVISPTTGHNHLDSESIQKRAIRIFSLKGETAYLSSVTATAELTWGLILSLTRQIPQALNHVASGGWDRDAFRGVDLSGRTLGIVGYGRLGRIIEDYARAFRMNILINDIAWRDPVFGKAVALEHLLAESDIVTVHVDVNPSSVNMFSYEQFRCMKRSAYFINTSRGELIDEDALVHALKEGYIAAAATDVIRDEQTGRVTNQLIRASMELQSRLLVTPHIAGASRDSMAKTENFIIEKVLKECLCAKER